MVSNSAVAKRLGPLSVYEQGYRAEMVRLGYARNTINGHRALMRRLSRWLDGQGLEADALSVEVAESFLLALRNSGSRWQPTLRTLSPLLGYLRKCGAVPVVVASVVTSPTELLLVRYRAYLADERGLAEATLGHYVAVARLFLSVQFPDDDLGFADLSVAEVLGFVTRRCPDLSVAGVTGLLGGLRAFLRFAHLEGLTVVPLAQVVPSSAGWSLSSLPRGLPAEDVRRMLAGCDRGRGTGRRDYAILTVLVRLGLRAGEVAALTLDDVDWRGGQIVVRGKGHRQERMPLPVDVGEVIVEYLQHGRPASPDRALFLKAHAPIRGLTPDGVSEVVRASSERVGLPGVGAHRLRHTAATQMLRAGAALSEVTQALRQHSAATTAIYAKIDHAQLVALVQPWPGVTQ